MVRTVRVLALDVDGVLTDGTAVLGDAGREQKRYSFQDLDAVTKAFQLGLEVALVTGEENPIVEEVAHRFGVGHVIQGAKDKIEALRTLAHRFGVPLSEFCYVGDGDRDAPAFAYVGLGLAPANATAAAKAAAHRVLVRSGGAGAVAEAVDLLTQLQSAGSRQATLEEVVGRIVRDSVEAHRALLQDHLPVLVSIAQILVSAIRTGHKILLFGNGGSAADAQHVAGELVGRFLRESQPWPAMALTTDSSILTAIGNDWDFDDVFARQTRALARPGDVVVGISTSGHSPNVLRGLQAGRGQGAVTIGFTGIQGHAMLPYTDECFCAPASSTPRIQELHLLAWHAICEIVESELMTPEGACVAVER
jgi:D-sedoheptulose 7-phosphate isomerase